ncbi:phage virion morphogenesis protein [Nocardioides ginsengisoli]
MRISGVKTSADRLRAVAARASDPSPVINQLPRVFAEHVSKTFATNGASVAKPWHALTPQYRALKAKSGSPHTLVLTGRLKQSFAPGAPYNIDRRSKNRLVWGTKAPHARLHQIGSAGGQLPARPMLVVTPELRREVRRKVRAYIVEGRR